VRETLFNWLMHDIAGARCLDLFAGSGALGLEALSRGAATVVFCDSNPEALRALRGHLASLQAAGAELRPQAALELLQAGPPAAPFDIVFLDPPFGQGLLAPCLDLLERRGWLAAQAKIYLESEAGVSLTLPAHWQLLREKTAGQVGYRLAQRGAAPATEAKPA